MERSAPDQLGDLGPSPCLSFLSCHVSVGFDHLVKDGEEMNEEWVLLMCF